MRDVKVDSRIWTRGFYVYLILYNVTPSLEKKLFVFITQYPIDSMTLFVVHDLLFVISIFQINGIGVFDYLSLGHFEKLVFHRYLAF